MQRASTDFTAQIAAIDKRLSAIPEQVTTREIRPGGWRGTEVLGHLVDSSVNNHQRFVRAALEGSYVGPGYDQVGWVTLHGYSAMPWSELLAHWRAQNRLLARVVEQIPDHRFSAECRVGGGAPVTLAFLVEDYLRHLSDHVSQIEALNDPTAADEGHRSVR